MAKIQAVLLDLDGTILNTFELMCQAFEHTFSSSNLTFPSRALIQAQMASGGTLETMYKNLSPLSDSVGLSMIHRTFESANLHLGQPFADTFATLDQFKAAGLKLAIVSNRSAVTLQKLMANNSLDAYFETVISGDDTQHHKPDPQQVQLALDRLNVSPENAVMIGDTGADIGAGKNAGSVTIGLTTGFCGDQISDFKPDLVAKNLNETIPFIIAA